MVKQLCCACAVLWVMYSLSMYELCSVIAHLHFHLALVISTFLPQSSQASFTSGNSVPPLSHDCST